MAKRKMSAEQRQAAIERLAKAREKRLKENPPKYANPFTKGISNT